MKVGMAIKPATSVTEVAHLLDKLDYILVMTVEPGFGGQKLLADCIPKVILILIILHNRNPFRFQRLKGLTQALPSKSTEA